MLNDDIEITVRRLTDVADGNQAVLSAARQYALARGLDAPSGVERFPHCKPRFVPEGLSFSVLHTAGNTGSAASAPLRWDWICSGINPAVPKPLPSVFSTRPRPLG